MKRNKVTDKEHLYNPEGHTEKFRFYFKKSSEDLEKESRMI